MEILVESLGMTFIDASKEVEIFSGIDFRVESASSLAIVGESGVGKTTLLSIIGGLERPTRGRVVVGEFSVGDRSCSGGDMASFRATNIGFVFQFFQLLPEFSALENVAMPLLIQRKRRDYALDRAAELLERVSLGHRLDSRPGTLSGGEQQRVAIARAFVSSPAVVLADEPTGNLDSQMASEVGELLVELHRERRITLVVVTHSLEIARRMDRVLRLRADAVVEEGAGLV